MNIERGDKFIYIGENKSKPAIAILCCDPQDYILKLRCAKTGNTVWCNSAKFEKEWSPVDEAKRNGRGSEELTGKQEDLFPRAKTVREQWRDLTLKKN